MALFPHRFWEEGEPHKDYEGEYTDYFDNDNDCVMITWKNKDWDDISCTAQHKRICESKAVD